MTPLISVIVPSFDRRAMLAEAIASVLAQSLRDFELIVIDDGSRDGTADYLRRQSSLLERSDVSFRVETLAHRGPGAARNRGAAMARGQWLAFLDSDDLWMVHKLQCQIAFMNDHPHLQISQCQELWVRNGKRVNPGRRHLKRGGEIFDDSLRTCLISPSAVIISRALFSGIGGFDESLPACEDYDLWLRILAGHEVGLLDEWLVTRRAGHADQLSATVAALDQYRVRTLQKLLMMPGLSQARRDAVIEVLGEKCGILAQGLERRGKIEEAATYRGLAVAAGGNKPDALPS